MQEAEYEKMYRFEDTYWWFQGRKSIIFSILDKYMSPDSMKGEKAVDLGCGTGLILSELNSYTLTTGVDFSLLALSFCKKRGIKDLVCADVSTLPFKDNSFDLIFALDLLEHIPDDYALMREIHRICRPGGKVMTTVPAYQYLWSEHDEALHHSRRYSKRQFRELITSTGFTPLKLSFCISFMFLPILLFRILQKTLKPNKKPKTHLIVLPNAINQLLIKLLEVEAWIVRRVNIPFGVSLLSLAEKK